MPLSRVDAQMYVICKDKKIPKTDEFGTNNVIDTGERIGD